MKSGSIPGFICGVGVFSLSLSKENPILFSDSYSLPASYCVKIVEYW